MGESVNGHLLVEDAVLIVGNKVPIRRGVIASMTSQGRDMDIDVEGASVILVMIKPANSPNLSRLAILVDILQCACAGQTGDSSACAARSSCACAARSENASAA
eukprot:5971517-Amphidinium_carterae.1